MGVLLAILIGCAGQSVEDSASLACDSGPALTWDNWAHGFFRSYCQPCHSADAPNRYDAPDSVNFDAEAEVWSMAASVRRTVLEDATMPVGGGVPEDELAFLDRYLACGE